MENTYKIPTTAVIHEFLGNEIIAANLDSGIYYSMRDCSVPVWQLLLSGKTLNEIAFIFSKKYNLSAVEISPLLQFFLQQLIDEAMLVSVDANQIIISDEAMVYWPENFNIPALEKYEEMKDLLMIDPVHEVDEQGWPVKIAQ